MKCSSEIQICSCHSSLCSTQRHNLRQGIKCKYFIWEVTEVMWNVIQGRQAANKECIIKPVVAISRWSLILWERNPETSVEHTPQSYLIGRNREWGIYKPNFEDVVYYNWRWWRENCFNFPTHWACPIVRQDSLSSQRKNRAKKYKCWQFQIRLTYKSCAEKIQP